MNDPQEPASQTPFPVPQGANPGYALGQLARALTTQQTHPDPGTRERAARKISRWKQVIQGVLGGTLRIGSRTPIAATPIWATLEIAKGGFATGNLLAEGPLLPHEQALLQQLDRVERETERAAINAWYLSESGFTDLRQMLHSGHFRVTVPEEGALLIAAWLAEQGHTDAAQTLLTEIGPWMQRLRFYPQPADRPVDISANVFRRTVGETIAALHAVRLRPGIARDREAVLIWAPLYDRAVALWSETVTGDPPGVPIGEHGQPQRRSNGYYAVAGGWPCQHYPPGWADRARALLDEYHQQRDRHRLCRKPGRNGESFAILRAALERCIDDPTALTGREVGQIRAILAAFALKRGLPGSPRHQSLRAMQHYTATAPTTADLAQMLIRRLAWYPQDGGLPDMHPVTAPVTADEAAAFKLTAGQPIPRVLERKVEQSLAAPIEVLVARSIVPSSEALARLVPQLSAQAQVAAIADPVLARLYSAIYTAFRRRRSLLLLNLQHQVTFEELPWVRVIEPLRAPDGATQAQGRAVLRQIVTLAITAFPQQILPNMLLREIRSLADASGLSLPIVDEVAADIFMGTFSAKYLRAAQWAGTLLTGSLYERYYGLPYAQVIAIDDVAPSPYGTATSPAFDRLCHELAAANDRGTRWSVARNGTIIEQEQILTTHNLAVLIDGLDLLEFPHAPFELDTLAQRCFVWICAEQQQGRGRWAPTLRMLKNTAYAWRQMIFFLALLPPDRVAAFLGWAERHLTQQTPAFRSRFEPALAGLATAAAGGSPEQGGRRFLGWTTERHWLMPDGDYVR